MKLCECGCGEQAPIVLKNDYRHSWIRKGESCRFLKGHSSRKKGLPFRVNTATGCWDWIRSKTVKGYGEIGIAGKVRRAHRIFYTMFRGSIQSGKQLDHLCRNRGCVNPIHLEIVTSAQNSRRGKTPIVTEELVKEIRARTRGIYGELSRLAREYGVSVSLIHKIVRGKTWRGI